MPGWANSDNKFGLTPYIVGTVLGDGCNYTSIQAAINDAFAAGGGVVGIRPGTYIENLTLQSGVELYGFDVDGRAPSTLSKVVVQGNHTFSVASGFGIHLTQYINFSAPAGDAITIQAGATGQAIVGLKFCGIEAFANPGQRCVVLDATSGGSVQFATDNTNLNSSGSCFEGIGAGSQSAVVELGNIQSQSADVYTATSGANSFTARTTNVSGAMHVFNSISPGNCDIIRSNASSSQEIGIFPAGSGSLNVYHSTISCSAGSGFWASGIAGATVNFGDVVLVASAIDIDPVLTIQKPNWQPYGEAAAIALGSIRGTASFDSAHFTVTDGFVQLAGAAGYQWIDQGVSAAAAPFTGYFITASPITMTLPAAPAQGTTISFKDDIGGGWNVAASGGNRIVFGSLISAPNGTITSTAPGDAVELTYRAASGRWIVNNSIGNWTIA